MTEPILADYPALVSAVMSIGEKLELHNDQRQWMNKEQRTSTSLCESRTYGISDVSR